MYAVVDIAGQQFKIEKDNKLLINRIKGEPGESVNFRKVLFIDDAGKVKIGTPYIKDASVTVKIVSHVKGDKIKVFKKKRRKGYKVLNGFRHSFTEVIIENISETAIAVKVTAKKETPKATVKKEDATRAGAATDADTVKKATAKATTKKAGQDKVMASAKKVTSGKKTATGKASAEKVQTAAKKPATKSAGTKPVAKKATAAKSTTGAKKNPDKTNK